jgi:hypothetical protein
MNAHCVDVLGSRNVPTNSNTIGIDMLEEERTSTRIVLNGVRTKR